MGEPSAAKILSHHSWFGRDDKPEKVTFSYSEGKRLQDDFGRRAFTYLVEVSMSSSNPKMRVDQIPDNGGSYSISVGVEDEHSFQVGGFDCSNENGYKGHPILDVSFNLTSRIHYPASLHKWIYDEHEDCRPGRECVDEVNFNALLAEMEAIIRIYDSTHRSHLRNKGS